MLRAYVMSCALTLLACSCLAAMLCLRDAACLGAHFGSRTPYERGSRGSGDPRLKPLSGVPIIGTPTPN